MKFISKGWAGYERVVTRFATTGHTYYNTYGKLTAIVETDIILLQQ